VTEPQRATAQGAPKISASLGELTQPYVRDDMDPEACGKLVTLAATAWNCAVQPDLLSNDRLNRGRLYALALQTQVALDSPPSDITHRPRRGPDSQAGKMRGLSGVQPTLPGLQRGARNRSGLKFVPPGAPFLTGLFRTPRSRWISSGSGYQFCRP